MYPININFLRVEVFNELDKMNDSNHFFDPEWAQKSTLDRTGW